MASNTDYLVCEIKFSAHSIEMTFIPHHVRHYHILDEVEYNSILDPYRNDPVPAGGASGSLQSGIFNRSMLSRTLSNTRDTQMAFTLPERTSWIFVAPGFDLNPDDLGFNPKKVSTFGNPIISNNGKVLEVLHTPPAGPSPSKEQYKYRLWISSVVPNIPQSGVVDIAAVTIIIDPIIIDGDVPP